LNDCLHPQGKKSVKRANPNEIHINGRGSNCRQAEEEEGRGGVPKLLCSKKFRTTGFGEV